MELRVIERDDDLTQVALVGRLDIAGVQRVDARFHEAVVARDRSAIIDLTELEFIVSLGIGMLLRCARSLRAGGKSMVLVNPQDLVVKSLQVTSLDSVIPVVKSVVEAEGLLK